MEVQDLHGSEETHLKIVSWNINGIRTVKNLKSLLDSFEADIVCLQETKVTRDMIDEPTALVEGYNAYFAFSRSKSGYSGVVTYCRENATPLIAEEGLTGTLHPQQADVIGCFGDVNDEFTPQELKRLDAEGRAVITQHKIMKRNGSKGILTVFNVYCPRADPDRPERLEYKLRFYRLLEMRVSALRCGGSNVVVVGDINTSHHHIDRCETVPQDEFEGNQGRQWLNSFIKDSTTVDQISESNNEDFKIVDSFRYFHPSKANAFTCWNTKINARATNFGSRIDYILVDCSVINDMVDSLILSDVMGSDHCPIVGLFNLKILKSDRCPSSCIKNFPEFVGVQQKLSSFFINRTERLTDTVEIEGRGAKRSCPDSDSTSIQDHNNKVLKSSGAKIQRDISSFFQKKSNIDKQPNFSVDGVNKEPQSNFESFEDSIRVKGKCPSAVPITRTVAVSAWRNMLSGPRPPPLCKGHKEPCVERTVKKKGPNFNKRFFCCARGEGSKLDTNARCDHFEWFVKR